MKRYLYLSVLACLFVAPFCTAQNLVPNPSFEDTTACPQTLALLSNTSHWNSPTQGSPDYFHNCSQGGAGIPHNIMGSQTASIGYGYVGISVYDLLNTYSYREYIQVQLQQPLISGQKYWVSFNVSLADTIDYAIKELGAYLSPTQVNDFSMDTTLLFTPQIEFTDSVITNKNTWTRISGSFTASGNKNYLIIGNFNNKQNTTSTQVNNTNAAYSYYYIDDICVSSDSLTCANTLTPFHYSSKKQFFRVFPNPVFDYLMINNKSTEPYDLTIYSALGQVLSHEIQIRTNNKKVFTQKYNTNFLILKVKTKNDSLFFKLLKS